MANTFKNTVLSVSDLTVALVNTGNHVVSDIAFSLREGEVLGLVGESGSGKTTLSSALLGYARHGAKIIQGMIELDGEDILSLDDHALRQVRGYKISHVAQDPGTALNPALSIGQHLLELLEVHQSQLSNSERQQKVAKILDEVGLPHDDVFLKRYPHQLSGGQQQRILLALAFLLQPRLIILDEPTTALDVTTQTLVLNIIRKLCREYNVAAIYVSHDLTVVKDIADRVIVLYSGRIAEDAVLTQLFETPKHPYTQGLLNAIPDVVIRKYLSPIEGHAPSPNDRPSGCAFAARCTFATDICRQRQPDLIQLKDEFDPHFVACHHSDDVGVITFKEVDHHVIELETNKQALLKVEHINAWYGQQQALFDVSFQLQRGECLALVGESGSGKTTLSRVIAGLNENAEGQVVLADEVLSLQGQQRSLQQRHKLQYIFQNPYKALNPAHTIGQTLTKVVQHFFALSKQEAAEQVVRVLKQVSLPLQVQELYPRDLSGGERQRVAIARALLCQPDVLICDEITSALDVSVQASILKLLQQLQQQGVTLLFVTHNLGVVRAIADRVAVLKHGHIVEYGETDQVLSHPQHGYTKTLLSHAPSLFKSNVHDACA
ncbi:ABC transporter ATP-binding protein [Acinetobacter sp. VNH17]|uniref:ABC transporter ATP-binding protein n=1 Tax=Acinetobacter thutiue TaxID=2998078 RepID=A0ABT7WLY2_9GAMM|nr:ABC transporter ATP-binding protein [Acinetobacter thutiue]MCY6411584.1 ABC transporter ATP-binding protein [Acinetobacter thutiue]MDN0013686.1 ABC transporter ATP-binding protein [Acinetobacter thutiue]